jgi:hypothetical protein
MTQLDHIIANAKEELEERVKDFPDEDAYDAIHEIADGSVPIYNADLLDTASDCMRLALVAPEIGPAFDGEPTPINIIAANIYEEVCSVLNEYLTELKEEAEDDEE